jgi:hypothetical protein
MSLPVGVTIPSITAPPIAGAATANITADTANKTAMTTASIVQMGLSVAGAIAAYYAYQRYTDRQESMLELQEDIGRDEYNRFTAFFAPCENARVQEYCAVPIYTPQYVEQTARARSIVTKAFTRARDNLLSCRSRFCVGQTAEQLNDLAIAEANAEAAFVTMAFRYEESRVDYKMQIRHDRIYSMLSLAKGIPMNSASIFGNVAGSYNTLRGDAQQALGQSINGIFRAWANMIAPQPMNYTGGSTPQAFYNPAYAALPTNFNGPSVTPGATTQIGNVSPHSTHPVDTTGMWGMPVFQGSN